MIQNMTKTADVVDDVAKAAPKPSATGKVVRGAAKGLGVLGVAVDADHALGLCGIASGCDDLLIWREALLDRWTFCMEPEAEQG